MSELLQQVSDLPRRYGEYRADIDPFCIRYLRRSHEWPDYVNDCPVAVCDGDWDVGKPGYRPFREKQMHQLFVEKVPFRETTMYKLMLEDLAAKGVTRIPRCRSVAEIDAYYERLYDLYESIKRNGYQPRNGDLLEGGEVTVRIGRDGGFIKCGQGTHRVAIARLLGLRKIPVVVDLVHWQWAQACARETGLPLRAAVLRRLEEISAAPESAQQL